MSSGDTRRFERSMYPAPRVQLGPHVRAGERRTLLFVDSENDDDLVAPNANKLLDGADAAAGELGEEDHALDAVVLEQLHVRAHLRDLADLDHHELVHLRIPRLVVAHFNRDRAEGTRDRGEDWREAEESIGHVRSLTL
jgi:hypothetical protein